MTVITRDFLNDERRQIFDYEGGNIVIFIGRAHPSTKVTEAAWQIRKFTYATNLITNIEFANGNSNFDKVWNDRADYDYTPD